MPLCAVSTRTQRYGLRSEIAERPVLVLLTFGPRARSMAASEIGRALGFSGVGENTLARLACGGFLLGIGASASSIRPGPALARHAGGHVFTAFVAQAHGGKRAAPAIARMGLHAHALVQRQGDERLPCLRATALAAFGRIYALQAQLSSTSARIGAHPKRVAIRHPRDRALPDIGSGASGSQQQKGSGKKARERKRQEERARQKHHGVRRAMKTCAANNAPALSEAMRRLRPLAHIRAAPFETLFKNLFAIRPWAQTARTRVGCGVANASPGCKTRLRFAPDSSSRFPILCSSRPDHEQVLATRHAPPRRQWPSDWLRLHQKQKQI